MNIDERGNGTTPSSVYSLISPVVGEVSAQRLLVGLEQAYMATRLGFDPDPVTLGRFALSRLVGRGGMGMVFEAIDRGLDRTVALKILTFESDLARTFAVAEARALARVAHPNIVTVFDAGVVDGLAYVAMEFVHGASLREWLRARPRALTELLPVFVAAGRGLAAAHAEGLLHRDFKPDNVLVGADGRVRVVDFGLARELGSVGVDEPDSGAGTPAYMAPERLRGEPATAAADQFAFCVAVWEACCGARPFTLEQLGQLGRREPLGVDPLVASTVAPIGADDDASPLRDQLLALLRVGLDPDPELRWPTLDALLERLDRLVPSPTHAQPPESAGVDPWTRARLRRERRWRVGLGLVGAAIVASSAYTGWWIAEVPDAPRRPDRVTPQAHMTVLSVGGRDPNSAVIGQAGAYAGQAQLIDAVFGYAMLDAYDDSGFQRLAPFADKEKQARAGARRWHAQICLHAYLSIGEGRLESSQELALCRMMVARYDAMPKAAVAQSLWFDEYARFARVFSLTLRSREPDTADAQDDSAQSMHCRAQREWARHLDGLEPSNRFTGGSECWIEPLQSGARPDSCVAYSKVPPPEHPSALMSEPISSEPGDG